eukprot:6720265-Heterocapsa_arctica.AAC.1
MGNGFVLQKVWWRLDWIDDDWRRRRGGRVREEVSRKSKVSKVGAWTRKDNGEGDGHVECRNVENQRG